MGFFLNILSVFSVKVRGTCVYKMVVPLLCKEDTCLLLSWTSAAKEIPFCMLNFWNMCGVSENVFCLFFPFISLCYESYHLSPVNFLCLLYNFVLIWNETWLTVKSCKDDWKENNDVFLCLRNLLFKSCILDGTDFLAIHFVLLHLPEFGKWISLQCFWKYCPFPCAL